MYLKILYHKKYVYKKPKTFISLSIFCNETNGHHIVLSSILILTKSRLFPSIKFACRHCRSDTLITCVPEGRGPESATTGVRYSKCLTGSAAACSGRLLEVRQKCELRRARIFENTANATVCPKNRLIVCCIGLYDIFTSSSVRQWEIKWNR